VSKSRHSCDAQFGGDSALATSGAKHHRNPSVFLFLCVGAVLLGIVCVASCGPNIDDIDPSPTLRCDDRLLEDAPPASESNAFVFLLPTCLPVDFDYVERSWTSDFSAGPPVRSYAAYSNAPPRGTSDPYLPGIRIYVSTEEPSNPDGEVIDLTVRGHEARSIRKVQGTPSAAAIWWQEAPGLYVSVGSTHHTLEVLQEVADGLVSVDKETWMAHGVEG
jgi:hypothetical protein